MRGKAANRKIYDRRAAKRLSASLGAVFLLPLLIVSPARGGDAELRLEGGSVSFSRNDVRIPGDEGTRFDLLDLTGKGPDPYFRLYGTYDFNDRHALRLTLAPLEVEGTEKLSKDVRFKDDVFSADVPTEGMYKFNTYRLTYRWSFHNRGPWHWGLGGAALVRDADITLQQPGKRESSDDLGLVPLLHLYGEYRLSDRTSVILDVEGAWSPMGRAVDAALTARYGLDSDWYLEAGYRTLEGGADNNDVYSFAWLHYAQVAIGYRF